MLLIIPNNVGSVILVVNVLICVNSAESLSSAIFLNTDPNFSTFLSMFLFIPVPILSPEPKCSFFHDHICSLSPDINSGLFPDPNFNHVWNPDPK